MKEVYLVKYSFGSYEDYRVCDSETVFINLFSAEKEKERIENYYTAEQQFPFDFCDEETFVELLYDDKLTTEDINKYDEWKYLGDKSSEFNGAWIETLKLEE